jgi:redox-sensitive bicupin YhaK (pirin superfamily)
VTVHQDVNLYSTILNEGEQVVHPIEQGRRLWVQVARGSVLLNGHLLSQGDAAALETEETLELVGQDAAEVLVFDLA